MSDILTSSNFLIYCAKHYDNPQCESTDEFLDDLMRIKYIKKLITRYIITGELKERLILNHLIVLNNVFGAEALCKIIWLKLPNYLSYIKPFLVMLNILPDNIYGINNSDRIDTTLVSMNQEIVNALRKI